MEGNLPNLCKHFTKIEELPRNVLILVNQPRNTLSTIPPSSWSWRSIICSQAVLMHFPIKARLLGMYFSK